MMMHQARTLYLHPKSESLDSKSETWTQQVKLWTQKVKHGPEHVNGHEIGAHTSNNSLEIDCG